MPLVVGTGAVLEPPVVEIVPAPEPIIEPYSWPLHHPTLSWTSPDGTVVPLGQASWPTTGYLATTGVAGLGLTPRTMATNPLPRGGTAIRHHRLEPRVITLTMLIEGPDHDTFDARWQWLGQSLASTRRLGPGYLTLHRPNGTARTIACYYQDGYERAGDAGPTADVVALSLYCPDGAWRDVEPTAVTRTYTDASPPFLTNFPTIASSSTLGDTIATNPGSMEAWPTWTITGPASSIVATNHTTGQSWTLDAVAHTGALTAGQTVTLATDPPAVTGPGGNWTAALVYPGSVLWGLDPGDNAVTFAVVGSAAGTSIRMEFFARYEQA